MQEELRMESSTKSENLANTKEPEILSRTSAKPKESGQEYRNSRKSMVESDSTNSLMTQKQRENLHSYQEKLVRALMS